MSQQAANRLSRRLSERRVYQRYEANLEAVLFNGAGQPYKCRILDYCIGGMRVALDRGLPPQQHTGLAPPEEVTIRLSLELDGNTHELGQRSRIVRLVEGGLGIAFVEPDPDFLRGLQQHTRAPELPVAPAAGNVPPRLTKRTRRAVSICQRLVNSHLPRLYKEIFRKFNVDLMAHATHEAANNLEQNAIFDDITVLESVWHNRQSMFLGCIQKKIVQVVHQETGGLNARPSETQYHLALVEESEFEDWLCVTDLAAKIHGEHSYALHRLRQLFGMLLNQLENQLELPVGPDIFGNAIHEILAPLDLRPDTKALVFQAAIHVLSNGLGDFYQELIEELSRNQLTASSLSDSPSETPGSHHVAPLSEAKIVLPSAPAVHQAREPGASQPSEQTYTQAQVMRLLEQTDKPLSGAESGGVSFKEQLLGLLRENKPEGAAKPVLEPRLNERIDYSEKLLELLVNDDQVSEYVIPWIKGLDVPLFKAALRNPAFFQENRHPIREIINQLEHVGMYIDGGDRMQITGRLAPVDRLVRQLVDAPDGDEETLSEVSGELRAIEEEYSTEYKNNVERVILACEGRQRIDNARRVVRKEINRRFCRQPIPRIVVDLLHAGWLPLLQLTYIRGSTDGKTWQQYLSLLETLIQRLSSPPLPEKRSERRDRELHDSIRLAIDAVSFDPFRKESLLNTVKKLLSIGVRPDDGVAAEMAVFQPLPCDPGEEDRADLEALPPPPGVTDTEWENVREQIRALREGDRIELPNTDGTRQCYRLVWIGENGSKYLFVDHRGLKAYEFTPGEIAARIRSGDAVQERQTGKPLVDRALANVIDQIETQLTYQASHDPLSGLINRRKFSALLEDSLAGTGGPHFQRLVCCVDIDQFKVVNNRFGYAAGDRLIFMASELLQSEIADPGVVGHLGGDEFAVLLENCSEAEGLAVAERLRESIRKLDFAWENTRFPVAASIGVVVINGQHRSADKILADAASACLAAKEGGRNRVRVYEETDEHIARQQNAMEWVVHINKALEEDSIQLRCQKIMPIHGGPEARSHYEILLGVYDEQDHPISVPEFIAAAERYNRMAELDRVIIRKAMDWIGEHREKTEQLGGFAINLSGHSLNDPQLPEIIRQHLLRTGVGPEKITFEVTETAAVSNLAAAARLIENIKKLGCRFALDDFGTGLSSYSYLKTLPVDLLKIDGAFVKNLADSPNDYAVVKSINEIGHFMGKQTIAEYVKNGAILAKLKSIGVDYAQGYGIEAPHLLADLA